MISVVQSVEYSSIHSTRNGEQRGVGFPRFVHSDEELSRVPRRNGRIGGRVGPKFFPYNILPNLPLFFPPRRRSGSRAPSSDPWISQEKEWIPCKIASLEDIYLHSLPIREFFQYNILPITTIHRKKSLTLTFPQEKEWVPCTKLGRLVAAGKIASLEDIYLHSLPIREYQIIDHFFPAPAGNAGALKDEVVKIHPVQKMTSAGQRNRFVCYALVGDGAGHIGLGAKVGKEVATAIRGAVIVAKINLIPVRRGYWGGKLGLPHTVPMKVRFF